MTSKEWWELLESNWKNLDHIIRRHHPKFKGGPTGVDSPIVTAAGAQAACNAVIADIQTKPAPDLVTIIKEKDTEKMMAVLNETWFGVPESRSYVERLQGWSELLDMVEQPPDDMPEHEDEEENT